MRLHEAEHLVQALVLSFLRGLLPLPGVPSPLRPRPHPISLYLLPLWVPETYLLTQAAWPGGGPGTCPGPPPVDRCMSTLSWWAVNLFKRPGRFSVTENTVQGVGNDL